MIFPAGVALLLLDPSRPFVLKGIELTSRQVSPFLQLLQTNDQRDLEEKEGGELPKLEPLLTSLLSLKQGKGRGTASLSEHQLAKM